MDLSVTDLTSANYRPSPEFTVNLPVIASYLPLTSLYQFSLLYYIGLKNDPDPNLSICNVMDQRDTQGQIGMDNHASVTSDPPDAEKQINVLKMGGDGELTCQWPHPL